MNRPLLMLILIYGLTACQGDGVQGDPGKVLHLPPPAPSCPAGYTGGTSFSQGDGTAANPYLICSPSDLILISSGPPEYLSKKYLLGQDLDLDCLDFNHPIGTIALPFTGELDGGGHTIANFSNYLFAGLTPTQAGYPNNSPQKNYIGLFGVLGTESSLQRAGVKNLNLTVGRILGNSFVGSLAGLVSNADIENVSVSKAACTITPGLYPYDQLLVQGQGPIGGLIGALGIRSEIKGATLTQATSSMDIYSGLGAPGVSTGSSGGLVGSVGNKSAISDSSSSAKVSCSIGTWAMGGLVGQLDGKITSSHSTSRSICGERYIGGLVGYVVSGATVSKSYALIDSVSSLIFGDWSGGLVGISEGTITQSYSQTRPLAVGAPLITLGGGLVGSLGLNASIENSYSRVEAKVSGALVGNSSAGTNSIKNSFAAGPFVYLNYSCPNLGTCTYGGGLLGPSSSVGSIFISFWDKESSNRLNTTDTNGKISAAIRQMVSYSGWNISSDSTTLSIWKWDMNMNDQLPYIRENLPQ